MKKALLFLVLAGFNFSVFLFSDEPWPSESWLLLGFEYGNFFDSYSDKGSTIKSYTGSPGINLGGYRFWNGKNIGFFIHDLFAFPVTASAEVNGVTTKKDLSNSFFLMQVGIIVGPGFRYNLSERFKLKYAVGLGFLLTTNFYTESTPLHGNDVYAMQSWSFGIGGDLGIKFDITNIVFLTAGSIFTFDFASYMDVETPYGSSSGWADKYFMFGLRPYIAAGMNLYWK